MQNPYVSLNVVNITLPSTYYKKASSTNIYTAFITVQHISLIKRKPCLLTTRIHGHDAAKVRFN